MLAILSTLEMILVVALTNFVIFGNYGLSLLSAVISVAAILVVAYVTAKIEERNDEL